MTDRAVLGEGPVARRVVKTLAARPGARWVVTGDERTAEVARETDATVVSSDPADADTLAERGIEGADSAFVAAATSAGAAEICRTVRAALPAVFVVAYGGTEGSGDDRLRAVADSVVDLGRATTDVLSERIGDDNRGMWRLRPLLRGIDRLAIVTHDNPDPDAIASAVALERIAERNGCETEVYYYGDISHQENRAFVNVLEYDLTNLAAGETPDADGFALVDHSRPGVNDGLAEDLAVDVVIDHHPPRAPVEARFVDLRSEAGATSTLLVEYLEQFDVDLAPDLATGLLFGIRVDTDEFTRETAPADFEAAAKLIEHADLNSLERIESPSVSPETMETIARAIQNRKRKGRALVSSAGQLRDRDALAQAVDQLIRLDGITTAVVYGVGGDTIYVSARARGRTIDLGEALRDAFGQIGSAGGHANMAGAQIEVGVLGAGEDDHKEDETAVEAVVESRLLQAIEAHNDRPVAGPSVETDLAEEYRISEDTPESEAE
jgi:nanoRNase/pAp phosphatase (c-di-AMP/oligoRNAs hydrolase)